MAEKTSAVSTFFKKPWAFPALIGAVIVIAGFLIWESNQPAHGTWRYGLCRQIIEFEYSYPTTFDIMSVTEDTSSARIYFAEKNSFGNERIVQADCDYQVDAARNRITLVRLSLDRKPVPKERIAFYNRLIPTLRTQELDTALPPPLPRSLDLLKR